MTRPIRCAISIGFILGFLLVSVGCGSRVAHRRRVAETDRLPRLEIVQPEVHERFEVRRTYLATVEPFEKVDLCAQVRGVVKPIPANVDIGRFVKENEPLITLDVPDLDAELTNKKALLEQYRNLLSQAAQAIKVAAAEEEEAQAQAVRYQAEVEFRRKQNSRVTALAQRDTVTPQLAEESKLQLDSAEAALAAAQAQVVTKKARRQASVEEHKVAQSRIKVAESELQRAQALVNFAVIRAPFDGVIVKRWVDTGATVKDANMPLLTVMRINQVRVLMDVPERDVPYIVADHGDQKGNPVEFELPALRDQGNSHRFKGTISVMASALDPVTRTMRVEAHLRQAVDNKPPSVKAQMTGLATVILAQRKATTVPASALVRNGSRTELYYLADPSGDPQRRVVKSMEVQLGVDDGKRVEIRAPQLAGQEWIVVRGAGVIRVGDQAIGVPPK